MSEVQLPISVCILCKNEEDRITKCLEPLKVFKEVIVMDTGSNDNSLNLIRQQPHVTLIEEACGLLQNLGVSLFNKAKENWIFWLDADEIVTPELIEELKQLFDSPKMSS